MRSLIVLFLLGSVAHAAPSAEKRAEAKQQYQNGLLKFDVAKYDEAVESFQRAYELIGDPTILYNIAQSYRLGQKYDRALIFYKNYLRRRPDAPNRAEVERRIIEMNEAVENQKRVVEAHPRAKPEPEKPPEHVPPVKPEVKKPELEKSEPPPPPSHRRALLSASAGLGGVAVLSLAAGGTMLGLAESASHKVEQAAAGHMEFTAALRDTDVRGRRFNFAGITLLAIGGASTVASVITLGIGLKRPSAKAGRAEHH